jgi:peroxiredoxin
LKENEVPWKSYVKKGADLSFIDAFHKQWSGALPATFIYDRKGNLRSFWEGITSYEELETTVSGLL